MFQNEFITIEIKQKKRRFIHNRKRKLKHKKKDYKYKRYSKEEEKRVDKALAEVFRL